MTHWYELSLQLQPNAGADEYYQYNLLNRSNENAGFDLYCVADAAITNECVLLSLGVAAHMVKVTVENGVEQRSNSHFYLAPRSSIYRKGLIMANSVGIIDSGYRGELKAPVWSITHNSHVAAGERLFQVLAPDLGWIRHVRLQDQLPPSARGTNGFGSTGV